MADNPAHDQLQVSQTQWVHYMTSYFTDPDGNLVNAKKLVDKDGNVVKDDAGNPIYIVDSANQTKPRKTWTVDKTQGASENNGKASYDQIKQDQIVIDDPSSPLKGQWNIEKATSEKVDGSPINTKDAPKENLSNDIADGTVENIYLIYTQPTNPDPVEPQPTTPSQPDQPGKPDHPGDSGQPTTPGQPAQPGEPGGQPVSPDEGGNGNPGENVNVPVDNNQVPGHIANDQSLTSQIAHHVNGTNKQTHQLPQTGNGANEKASALGFLFAGLASIFSLAGRRKKKH